MNPSSFDEPSSLLPSSGNPEVSKLSADLNEIADRQTTLSQTQTAVSNLLSPRGRDVESVDGMMQVIRMYRDKLTTLRADMLRVHGTTRSLKERALEIQRVVTENRAEKIERRYYEQSLIKKKAAPKGPSSETKND